MRALNLPEEQGRFRSTCFDTFFLVWSIGAFSGEYFRKFSSLIFKKRKNVECAPMNLGGLVTPLLLESSKKGIRHFALLLL